MRAVDALMECLKAEGVDVVFGLPGGANLPTYDAFYDAGIRNILVRHEAGGGHAAEGYAKATGKVGVALGTSGPGATNLVTPICDAMMDSVPVVFLTGQVRTDLLGTDGFQEADTIGITMPIVKHSFMIQHPLEIPRSIHEAFHIARTGRPGPVVVDIPQDLSRGDIPYEPVSDLHLPEHRLAACLEINRFGETFLGFLTTLLIEFELLGRRHWPLVCAGHLAFRRHGLSTLARLILSAPIQNRGKV